MLEVVLTIPFWLELAASLTGGISGAMNAVRARYDLFGVCCIAIVTGLAGGIIRDILLQNYGIYAFQKPSLIVACVVAGIIVFYFSRLTTYLGPVMNLLDNLSVALWAIISVGKSMSAGMDIIPAAILGTITAVGGGICRDICMNREPISFQAGALYGSAAFLGALAYALMNQNHVLADYAPIVCVVLVLGIRYGSLLFGWHTKPPRDYTDVLTRPAKAVANRVVRAPKGKVARDKEHRRRSERLHRLWLRLNGEYVPMPGKTGKMKPVAANAGAGDADAGGARDPFEPTSKAPGDDTAAGRDGGSGAADSGSAQQGPERKAAGTGVEQSREVGGTDNKNPHGSASGVQPPESLGGAKCSEPAKPGKLLPDCPPEPDAPSFDDASAAAIDEPHLPHDPDEGANPSLTGRFSALPQRGAAWTADRRAKRAYQRSLVARTAAQAAANRAASDRVVLSPEEYTQLKSQLKEER